MSANSAFGNIVKRGMPVPFSWEYLVGDRRSGHEIVTPKGAEWLAERAEFVRKWEAMQEEGLDRGFLDNAGCYECGGAVEPTTDTEDRKWVFDEEDLPPVHPLILDAVRMQADAESARIDADLKQVTGWQNVSDATASELRVEVVYQQRPLGADYRGIRQNGEWAIDHHPEWGPVYDCPPLAA